MTDSLKIVQLYPDLLGVTGDKGNVDVLAFRAHAMGLDVTVEHVGIGSGVVEGADIVVIGNGPLSAIRRVLPDLAERKDTLVRHLDDDGVLFAVGGGAEALSSGISVLDGEDVTGLGILPFRVQRTRERRVGYIIVDTGIGRLIGFEDHASEWILEDSAEAWGNVVGGVGSVSGGREGLRVQEVFASNVQGPQLPLNPEIADALIAKAAARRGIDLQEPHALKDVNGYANEARAKIEELHTKRFNAIQL